jgi:serine/threonine protein phosphatase PrpC
VLDSKTAVDSVSGMSSAQAMAEKLVNLALKKGTTDNVSCMVVRLRE